jgi:hypothetical protein
LTRAKGFATWKPHAKTEILVGDVERVLDEYRDYLPLTIRQIFYRLVGLGYPKTEKFYKNKVIDVCNRGRRSGRFPFYAIRDDGVSRQGGESFTWESPEDYYRTHEEISNFYERSWHAEQPAYVAVLCEASGMVPMVESAVEDYRIEVASSSGFDSLTVKHDLYRTAVYREQEFGQRTILLHMGDHDPSGVSVYESMAADFSAFCADDGREDIIEMKRVALTPSQITELGIATTPDEIKPSDSRSESFLARGLDPAAQLEAIPPDTIGAIVRQAVEENLDADALARSRAQEQEERHEVQETLDRVNGILRDAFGFDE